MRLALAGYPLLAERQWKLCREFEKQGVETHLLVPERWPQIPEGDYPSGDTEFAVHRHGCLFAGSPGRHLLRGVGKSLRRIEPDVLLSHGEPWLLETARTQLVCDRLEVPHAVFSWENLQRVPASRLQRLLERWTLDRAAGVVAGSDAAADRLRARGFDGPVGVAPQSGVDTEMFRPGVTEAGLREDLGVPPDSRVLLYAGRLAAEKGLADLLDTVPGVRAETDAHYLLVGRGDLEGRLRRRIDEEGLADSVTLLGERQPYERIPAIDNLASVFVYPSRTQPEWAEQFGYSVVEAMSCGVPVVTTDCGALPSVVGDAGVVVPERDTAALEEALLELLSDDDCRAELGERGRSRAVDEFSLASVAEAQLEHIQTLSRTHADALQ